MTADVRGVKASPTTIKWATAVALLLGVGNVPANYYVTQYRIDQLERESDQTDAKIDKIDERLRSIESGIARIEGRLQRQGD